MGDVTVGRFHTILDIPVDSVLEGAAERQLRDVVVIGTAKDGQLYIASSSSDMAGIVWQMEIAKLSLIGAS